MRLDIQQAMNYFVITNKGVKPNFSEFSRRFQVDRRTVQKYYKEALHHSPMKPKPKPKRSSILEPFYDLITEKYKDGCSAAAIHHFLKAECGYQVCETTVRNFCHSLKQTETKKAVIRVETNPGLSAQVDWKESITFTTQSK
jgi:transposase